MTQAAKDTNKRTDEKREEIMQRNQAVIALLNSWDNEDVQDQRETLDVLMRTLDADRLSSRRLFW